MRCPSLIELPPPPSGKTGWPWTVETAPLPSARSDGSPWPCISIVTCSYNQGEFIEETIRSVLLQGYPKLQYVIIDGGSSDSSVEIVRKYERWLTYWVSEKDSGQVEALNKGFRHVNGEYLNWLNSDDFLLPNALKTVACVAQMAPESDFISATRFFSTSDGALISFENAGGDNLPYCMAGIPHFPQDSTFFSRQIWEKIGGLDDRLHYIFDTAFYAAGLRLLAPVAITRVPISVMHVYAGQKTNRHDPSKKAAESAILNKEYLPRTLRAQFVSRLSNTRLHLLAKSLSFLLFANRQHAFVRVEFDISLGSWKRLREL